MVVWPTPEFLDLTLVLNIHTRQIEKFGGTDGIRDEGLLESALAQPQVTFGGQLLHPSIPAQAAAYLYHLAMNHPFIDGNKRTAFAVMDTFLRVNGYVLTLSNEKAYYLVMQVVQKQISKSELILELEKKIEKLN
ncbi:type II toxin-antitoxin system death-on-curing family toxin [Chroococcus sp. FPU101]|uniref:type II toxin-antitoxin system death-on-curing family toxin n=1 Tax=Chroococcus sp. FPU101 TaxID=1974212 RepID=UPI001A8F8F26|nr:type II toxin-antitoxin system death-on-curing family toxin [Chroococcus sp. FPU101]